MLAYFWLIFPFLHAFLRMIIGCTTYLQNGKERSMGSSKVVRETESQFYASEQGQMQNWGESWPCVSRFSIRTTFSHS